MQKNRVSYVCLPASPMSLSYIVTYNILNLDITTNIHKMVVIFIREFLQWLKKWESSIWQNRKEGRKSWIKVPSGTKLWDQILLIEILKIPFLHNGPEKFMEKVPESIL